MPGPIDGVRVLDFGAFGVGPQACALLGVLGAEVIRIEPPYGDGLMRVLPLINGMGSTYIAIHHNSKSIVLDLTNEADKEIAYRLIGKADVLVENRRLGALEKMGFGYPKVADIAPRIIYISAPAYGHSGPLANYGGADHFLQATSGIASLNGQVDGPPELLRYVGFVDVTASVAIMQACLAALVHRQKTGRGQYVEMDEFSCGIFLQATRIAEYFAARQEPRRIGSQSSTACPSKAYRTQDEQYILISAPTRRQWLNLCEALEMTESADDERFATNDARLSHRDEVNDIIQRKVEDKPLTWWLWELGRHDVPHSKVMGPEDVFRDEHILQNKHVVELESPWGPVKLSGVPWRFLQTSLDEVRAPPHMDEDRDYVLSLIK